MAKPTHSATPNFSPFQVPGFEQFAKLNSGGFENLFSTGNALMKAVGELNAEILGFTKQRLDAGIAVSQSLAQCKSVQAAMEVQMDFARSESEVYLNEARKIMDMATHVATEGLKPITANGSNGHARANGKR